MHFVCVFLAPPHRRKQFCIEDEDNAYAKLFARLGGKKHANKVYYGKCGNGEFLTIERHGNELVNSARHTGALEFLG